MTSRKCKFWRLKCFRNFCTLSKAQETFKRLWKRTRKVTYRMDQRNSSQDVRKLKSDQNFRSRNKIEKKVFERKKEKWTRGRSLFLLPPNAAARNVATNGCAMLHPFCIDRLMTVRRSKGTESNVGDLKLTPSLCQKYWHLSAKERERVSNRVEERGKREESSISSPKTNKLYVLAKNSMHFPLLWNLLEIWQGSFSRL